jgi:SAM-dependent methyltransferase
MSARDHAPAAPDDPQREVNDRAWRGDAYVRAYATRELRPVEVVLLERYRDALGGRVLELGCGAGRLTGYLAELSPSVIGIDLSPAMIAFCRAHYPAATFDVRDLRDVARFGPAAFDAVVAPYNVIDVLGDAERRAVLTDLHEIVRPGGLLILSSHNRAIAGHAADGLHPHPGSLRALVGMLLELPLRLRNHRRLERFERSEADYAIVNDVAHNYALLHYYIERDVQARQLAAAGFELIECLDLDGRPVGEGERSSSSELHYVARRTESAPA